MKKFFLLLVIAYTFPGFILAETSINQLPQEFQNLINSDPALSGEIQKAYNTTLDFNDTGVKEQISFINSTSVPKPGQLITTKIENYSYDLNRLQISWYINDVLVKREIGATQHQFTVGELGKTTKVRVVILKPDGQTIEKTYSYRPAEVDLIYEAETFTPPFYEGKAYFSRQSSLKVVAMPQVLDKGGKYVDSKNLSYKWYLDGSVVQNQSGYGKNTFNYTGALLSKGARIGVEISTIEDGAVANNSIFINPTEPKILIYEKSPDLGTLYNKIVGDSFSINKTEIEFEAVPYFFKKDSILNKATVYSWKLNGQKINAPNQNSLVFRNENNQDGTASISIDVSNETILQKAREGFSLIFGQNNNLNDFIF